MEAALVTNQRTPPRPIGELLSSTLTLPHSRRFPSVSQPEPSPTRRLPRASPKQHATTPNPANAGSFTRRLSCNASVKKAQARPKPPRTQSSQLIRVSISPRSTIYARGWFRRRHTQKPTKLIAREAPMRRAKNGGNPSSPGTVIARPPVFLGETLRFQHTRLRGTSFAGSGSLWRAPFTPPRKSLLAQQRPQQAPTSSIHRPPTPRSTANS